MLLCEPVDPDYFASVSNNIFDENLGSLTQGYFNINTGEIFLLPEREGRITLDCLSTTTHAQVLEATTREDITMIAKYQCRGVTRYLNYKSGKFFNTIDDAVKRW